MNEVVAIPESKKTHYRKAFNSPYLSSADITETTTVMIACVKLEIDRTKKTKDFFNTAYFTQKELRPGEPLKPMILNATNSKTMKAITGSAFIDDWKNVPVNIFVDPSVRFGKETVEGLRIAKASPPKPADLPASDEQLAAIQEYREAELIPEVTLKWLDKQESITAGQAKALLDKLAKGAE
jgi:hypothetical protein